MILMLETTGLRKSQVTPGASTFVKGVYCLVIELAEESNLKIGSLGSFRFSPGTYVYVGSARNGIEKRVGRHKSSSKRKRWHIDYLLEKADVVASFAMPSEREDLECELAEAVSRCEDATCPVKGFGSSDCRCDSHLYYFGDLDPENAFEELTHRLAGLECIYPRSSESKAERRMAN